MRMCRCWFFLPLTMSVCIIVVSCQSIDVTPIRDVASASWVDAEGSHVSSGTHYMGSENGYDYFHIDVNGQTTVYRVRSSEVTTLAKRPLSQRREDWRAVIFRKDSQPLDVKETIEPKN